MVRGVRPRGSSSEDDTFIIRGAHNLPAQTAQHRSRHVAVTTDSSGAETSAVPPGGSGWARATEESGGVRPVAPSSGRTSMATHQPRPSVTAVLEQRTVLGRYTSATVLTMVAAAALSAAGLLPAMALAYETIWSWFLPLASVLFLLETKVTGIGALEAKTMAAFFVGAIGSCMGTLLAWAVVGSHLGAEGWKLAGCLCATYIGGSINFAATAQALQLKSGLAGAMAADNIAMALYLAVISSIPVKVARDAMSDSMQSNGSAAQTPPQGIGSHSRVGTSVFVASLVCLLGNLLASVCGLETFSIAISALLASVLAAVVNSRTDSAPFRGSQALGGLMLLFFFATIGASAGSLETMAGNGWILAFILIQLSVHLGLCLGFQRVTDMPMEAVLTASNANVGGPGTAAATAVGRSWPHMVRPALLTGSIGYAIGTVVGLAIAKLVSPA